MDDYDTLGYITDDLQVVLERLRGLNDEYIVDTLLINIETLEDLVMEIEAIRANIETNGGEFVV